MWKRELPGKVFDTQVDRRVNSRDPLVQMLPIGSHLIDANGVALLQQWITGLTCDCQGGVAFVGDHTSLRSEHNGSKPRRARRGQCQPGTATRLGPSSA